MKSDLVPFLFACLCLTLLSGCALAQGTPAAPTVTPSAGWKLAWADEFDRPDGAPIDGAKWTALTGGGGWGNGEWQHYTERVENAFHQDGALVIQAIKEEYKGDDYTSARLVTRGKADFTYGRFEARAKLPTGSGLWSAIWMLPTGSVYGAWPNSGEIDIVELFGNRPASVAGTIHYGKPHEFQSGTFQLPGGGSLGDDFHVYAVEWEPAEFRFFVDGYHYHTATRWFTSSTKGTFPAPFDQPFHLVMNLTVGGAEPGLPDENTTFPARMLVDYVRVYGK